MAEPPTIYEWAGLEAFERWLNAFCDLVEADELLDASVSGGYRGSARKI
jgi:hypothetical protein